MSAVALVAVATSGRSFAQSGTGDATISDVPALQQQLYETSSRPEQRDQAAQRLLSRPDPAARTALTNALQQYSQPAVQLAAARALADHPTSDAALKNPLFALLDTSSSTPLIDAAARALTAFKTDDDVMIRLLALARDGNDERVRVAAIRSAGTFVDQRAAQALIDLLDPSVASTGVNAAAAKSLAYLSGQEPSQTTAAGLRSWWNENKQKPALQFRADMALRRDITYDRSQAAVGDLQSEFLRVLGDQYQRLPGNQKADALVRYLRSPEAAVRVVGCQIARTSAENAEIPQTVVKDQLRQLIGDASPAVRGAAGEALALINDPNSLTPLLTQLNQETDTAARIALIKALRPIGDPRATQILLASLDDPSMEVAQAAADSISELAPRLRQQDPNSADKAAVKLMATLKDRTTPHDDNNLRYALVQAMIPLQSRGLARSYMQMVSQPTEVPRVRRALLNAMGELHDPQLADTIASSLNDADNGVRLAAVKALGASGISLGTYDRPLADLIDPKRNVPGDIRDAAWNVLATLFAKAELNQLTQWESVPGVKEDPYKLLLIYREERARAHAMGNQDMVASKNQQIGDACSDAQLFGDAIVAYLDALQYVQQNNKTFRTELVSEGIVKAYLAQKQYDQAVNFVQNQIKTDKSLEGSLGPLLPQEAERLANDAKDFDSSLSLIDLVLKMKPQLSGRPMQRIRDVQSQVQKRSREQNLTPFPPSENGLNA